jgi:hypothetical protein
VTKSKPVTAGINVGVTELRWNQSEPASLMMEMIR